jgi:hypothetical protein
MDTRRIPIIGILAIVAMLVGIITTLTTITTTTTVHADQPSSGSGKHYPAGKYYAYRLEVKVEGINKMTGAVNITSSAITPSGISASGSRLIDSAGSISNSRTVYVYLYGKHNYSVNQFKTCVVKIDYGTKLCSYTITEGEPVLINFQQ